MSTKNATAKKPSNAAYFVGGRPVKKSVASTKSPAKKPAAKKVERIAPVSADEKLVVLKSFKNVEDLPKQAQTILSTLKAKGGKLTLSTLLKFLDKALDTVQGSKRIYAFYQRRLIDEGFITTAKA
jgi:hypothetical protein